MFAGPDMYAFTDCVKSRLLLLLVLQISTSLSITVNIHHNEPTIVAKRKIQLAPVRIACFLSDIVRLTAPMINYQDQYYLSRPNGVTSRLDLQAPKEWNINRTRSYYDKSVVATFIENSPAIVNEDDVFSVFKEKEFERKLSQMEPNQFMVGPLLEEDYGNWVLSTYTKDLNGEWIELFQVYTMAITEFTILDPIHSEVHVGGTFNLSFAFPFPAIETCEVIAPRSTFDRFFERTLTDFNKCGFSIPNITMADQGVWRIIGFGRIVYQGDTRLYVVNPTPSVTEATLSSSSKTTLNVNNSALNITT